MTQCEKILQYMKDHGQITPLDALREFSCMRLAARIADLRNRGYEINSEIVSSLNRSGEVVRFSVYTLGENHD